MSESKLHEEQPPPEQESEAVARSLRGSLGRNPLTIVVFGASGHLARTKTYPALLELYELNVLPPTLNIVGYARSKLELSAFRERIGEKLKGDSVKPFLELCTYFSGTSYSDPASYEEFAKVLAAKEKEMLAQCRRGSSGDDRDLAPRRLFYFAVPPGQFIEIAACVKRFLTDNQVGFHRVIVEKPFGKDIDSCRALLGQMAEHLREDQTFRIDHYLAKEMVQNIMVLRFANTIWDTIWDRRSIRCVKISMKESAGVAGRGGYYDEYGVIRDIFQNHLMQVLCLVAMEAPVSLSDEDIRNEKVKVLKSIDALTPENTVVGQYDGYKEDESVKSINPDSNQLTFMQTVVFIKNKRWSGVPFVCKCGKGLDGRSAIVRIQFKNDGIGCLYPNAAFNEVVIRLQPREAVWLKLSTKKPGFARFDKSYSNVLDLTYQNRFEGLKLPGGYTRLILDALSGDQSLFVRDDELIEAWRIVDPLLKKYSQKDFKPIVYPMGSRGPVEADEVARTYGFVRPIKYDYKEDKATGMLTRRVSDVRLMGDVVEDNKL